MKEITGIHVLKIGDSTSADGIDTFHTLEDLKQLSSTYDPNLHEAPVILGHDSDEDWSKLMSRDDSEPSYGWVKRLYVQGKDLYCDIDASDELVEFIDEKKYKKRSLGYYGRNSKTNPKPGELYVRHLAMLGASPPAIKGLNKEIKLAEEKVPENQDIKTLLDTNAENWLAFLLKDNGNIVRETIVGFDPKPSEENNWLYNIEEKKFSGTFVTDKQELFDFEIVEQASEEGGESEYIVSVKPRVTEEVQMIEGPDDNNTELGELKMGQLVKEKTTTEKEYMEDKPKMAAPEDTMTEMNEPMEKEMCEMGEEEKEKEEMEMGGSMQYADEEVPAEAPAEVPAEAPAEEPVAEEAPLEEETVEIEGPAEVEMADSEIEAMKEELAMLRAKVKAQEDAEMKKREEEMIRFSEALYTENKVLETQFPKDDLINLFKGLMGLSNEHMVYGEGDNKKSLLDEVKRFAESLPKQVEEKVQLAEGLVEAPKRRNAVKFNPNYSRGSEERRLKILSTMDERKIDRSDMYAYAQIAAELNRELGPYNG